MSVIHFNVKNKNLERKKVKLIALVDNNQK